MKNYVKEHRGYRVPEGATHWQPEGGEWLDCFIKYEGDESMYINAKGGDSWKPSYGVVSPFIYELPEVEQEWDGKEWDGEGLPPVGVECEISYDGHHWIKCLINYSSESIVVCTNNSGVELAYSTKDIVRFRPVKTQEQKDLSDFVEKCHESTNEMGTNLDAAFIDLYEAGARFK